MTSVDHMDPNDSAMRVERTEATDVIFRDGEAAVLLHANLIRLSPVSARVYELAAQPVTLDSLAEELATRFGHPAHGSVLDATKEAVTDLVRHGLLRIS